MLLRKREVGEIRAKNTITSQIEQYVEYCKFGKHLTAVSVKGKTDTLRTFHKAMLSQGVKYVEDITNETIDRWINEMTDVERDPAPIRNNTVNGYLSHVRCFLSWCRDMQIPVQVRIGLIEHLKPEEVERIAFTREEVNRALNFADRRTWLFIKLSFDCGLRISELSKIQAKDIRDDRIRIHGKGRKDADVFVSREVARKLQDWIRREKVVDYLWRGQKAHTALSTAQIRREMRKPFAEAGLSGFHPHALRYSCATEAYDMGATSDETKEVLRHSNVKTTERYIQRSEVHIRRVFQSARYSKRMLAIDHAMLH